jgi:hypothetical protein
LSIRELITSGGLSVEEGFEYSERLSRAFEEVWRRYQVEAGPEWPEQRMRLYAKINGKQPNLPSERSARKAIGRLVQESGCGPSTVREINRALRIDWKYVRNTANLTLATSD